MSSHGRWTRSRRWARFVRQDDLEVDDERGRVDVEPGGDEIAGHVLGLGEPSRLVTTSSSGTVSDQNLSSRVARTGYVFMSTILMARSRASWRCSRSRIFHASRVQSNW